MWTTPELPRQDLPPLPPSEEVETPAVLKAVIAASRQLSALKVACSRLPDPAILINTIPLLEAQASSEIENIVTTNDELFRAVHNASDQPITPAVKEALRYRQAMRVGSDLIAERPLGVSTAIEVCTQIRGVQARIRDHGGTFIGNPRTKERIYTPPEGREVITKHLGLWEDFLHRDHGIDPLVVMALQHYQFEAIHPFSDGNGRTGRVLNMLTLMEKDLLGDPVLYLSGYIVRHKQDYYTLLRGVTERDEWEPWILFMVSACEVTAAWTLQLIETITAMQAEVEGRIRTLVPRAPAADLARLLFTQPYIRIENITEAGYAQRQAASRWLSDLVRARILEEEKIGRGKIFVNAALLDILFEAPLA